MAFTTLKGKHLLLFWYPITQKHSTFNKGEYIGYLEPAIKEDTFIAQQDIPSTNSVTLQKIMSE